MVWVYFNRLIVASWLILLHIYTILIYDHFNSPLGFLNIQEVKIKAINWLKHWSSTNRKY